MSADWTIRPAREGDDDPCGRIMRLWIEETPWFASRRQPEEDAPFLARKRVAGTMTVAEKAGVIGGFMVLEADYIACLYLHPAARNRGLGRRFLGLARARNPSGLNLWTFQANAGARRFYEREGFRAEMTTDGAGNEEGLPDVMYSWDGVG